MTKWVVIGIICCLAVTGMAATSWETEQEKQKTPEPNGITLRPLQPVTDKEQEVINAWADVDKQSIASLEAFLTKYKDSKDADLSLKDAELFLSLARKVDAIRSGMAQPSLVIPFDKLPDKWRKWKTDYVYGGAVGFNHTEGGDVLYLPRGCMGRTDEAGDPVLPTKDGSILIFKSEAPNPRWVWEAFFNGVVVQSEGKDPIYFAVMEKLGIVHLQGRCTVTMPDKRTITIQ